MLQVKVEEETLNTGIEAIDSSSAVVSYSFFRLLFPDLNFLKQLRLPRSFSYQVQMDKQNKHRKIAELINPKGKSWKVNLCKDSQGFYCFSGKGWQILASAHHLELGYFLTFDYNGCMIFSFRVYDLNTTEIEDYPSKEEEEEKKKDEGKAVFETVIGSYNLVGQYMNIPKASKRFIELSKEGKKRKIVLMDEEGRKWPVRIECRKRIDRKERSYISSGWLRFAHGNALRRGDRCVFEMFCQRAESLIKVRIIRGT